MRYILTVQAFAQQGAQMTTDKSKGKHVAAEQTNNACGAHAGAAGIGRDAHGTLGGGWRGGKLVDKSDPFEGRIRRKSNNHRSAAPTRQCSAATR